MKPTKKPNDIFSSAVDSAELANNQPGVSGKGEKSKMAFYAEAASRLQVSTRTVMRWINEGCDVTKDSGVAEYLLSKGKAPSIRAMTSAETMTALHANLELEKQDEDAVGQISARINARIRATKLTAEAKELMSFSRSGKRRKNPTRKQSLYLFKNKNNGYYKIGISIHPEQRIRTLQAEEPDIQVIKSWPALGDMEKFWHSHFFDARLRGEWFKLTASQVRYMVSRMGAGDARGMELPL